MWTAQIRCAHCAAPNAIVVDPANGDEQQYLEDCQVCCRPNLILVRWRAAEPQVVATAP